MTILPTLNFGENTKANIHEDTTNTTITGLNSKVSDDVQNELVLGFRDPNKSELAKVSLLTKFIAFTAVGQAVENSFIAGKIATVNNHHLHDLKDDYQRIERNMSEIQKNTINIKESLKFSMELHSTTNAKVDNIEVRMRKIEENIEQITAILRQMNQQH